MNQIYFDFDSECNKVYKMNKSELKKRLLDARELTTKHKGKMPLVIVCETQDEVNELNKIKKTMRNVKHIDIELTNNLSTTNL